MKKIREKLILTGEPKSDILQVVIAIAKEEGWAAVSMRKVASILGFSVPTIYLYYKEKGEILSELSSLGFQKLYLAIKKSIGHKNSALINLKNLWTAYLKYGHQEKELYQLMFCVNVPCNCPNLKVKEMEQFASQIKSEIKSILGQHDIDEDKLTIKFNACWSLVHGLIAIDMVQKRNIKVDNQRVLDDFNRCLFTY